MMLVDGIHHVATLTADTQRLHAFYQSVFEAEITLDREEFPGARLSVVEFAPGVELNVFQIDGNIEATRQRPMFGRGRLDHLGLRVADIDTFAEVRSRLMAAGASDGFVTDFGPTLSVFYTDPDGLEGEVLVANPDAVDGVHNKPGTPSARFRA
jgi:catechol 2,3-dioxygenase-like lactoylglutathione lyase family enzyme